MRQYLTLIFLITTTFFITNISFAQEPKAYGSFNVNAAIDALPETSIKPFVDARLVDNGGIGIRVFRVYNPVPRHNHAYSSTYLKIESGRALFSIDGGEPFEAGAGDFVFWQRGIDHQILQILEHPLTFLAIDTPTRREGDVQTR